MAMNLSNLSEIDEKTYVLAKQIVATVDAHKEWRELNMPKVAAPPATEPALLNQTDAAVHLGVGITKFKELRKRPEFPKPVGTKSRPMWRVVDLDRWIAKQRPRE